MISLAMMSFVAGNVAVLSPCVLPAVPFIVSSALEQHKWGAVAIALGLISSFTIIGISVASFGSFLGIDQHTIRMGSAWLMTIMGLVFLSGRLQGWMNTSLNGLANKANKIISISSLKGLRGQYILGLLVGAVWSPCIGPTLGSAIALAGQAESRLQGSFLILIYGLGVIIPFLLLAYGSRYFGHSKNTAMKLAKSGKSTLGIFMVVFGISVLTGLDKSFEGLAFELMPEFLLSWLTSI